MRDLDIKWRIMFGFSHHSFPDKETYYAHTQDSRTSDFSTSGSDDKYHTLCQESNLRRSTRR